MAGLRTEPYDGSEKSIGRRWNLADDEIIGRRSFTIGNAKVMCLDYMPSYLRYGSPYDRPVPPEDEGVAFVKCSDGRRLFASMSGSKRQVATLYQVIGGITRIQ